MSFWIISRSGQKNFHQTKNQCHQGVPYQTMLVLSVLHKAVGVARCDTMQPNILVKCFIDTLFKLLRIVDQKHCEECLKMFSSDGAQRFCFEICSRQMNFVGWRVISSTLQVQWSPPNSMLVFSTDCFAKKNFLQVFLFCTTGRENIFGGYFCGFVCACVCVCFFWFTQGLWKWWKDYSPSFSNELAHCRMGWGVCARPRWWFVSYRFTCGTKFVQVRSWWETPLTILSLQKLFCGVGLVFLFARLSTKEHIFLSVWLLAETSENWNATFSLEREAIFHFIRSHNFYLAPWWHLLLFLWSKFLC